MTSSWVSVPKFEGRLMSLPNNQSKVGVFRSTAIGVALLAFITAPGTCLHLYGWIVTGNADYLNEAPVIFVVASFTGGSGGTAYHIVINSRIKDLWKPFVAFLAAIEAYLFAFSLLVFVISRLAPKLTIELPINQVQFYLVLHGYGGFLCVLVFGIASAPRIAKITIGGVTLLMVLLSFSWMIILLGIGPEDLDLWFRFLKPLCVMWLVLIMAAIVVSIVGWLRHFPKKT